MKYTKLISKALLLLSTTCSIANAQTGSYLKVGMGLNTITPFKITDAELKGKTKLTQTFPLIELGVGYRINDRIRTEIAFDYYFLFKSKELSSDKQFHYNYLTNTKINALFASAYIDTFKTERTSLFFGGGIGMGFHKEKVGGYAVCEDTHCSLIGITSKQTNNFAYKLTTGLDFRLSDLTNVELTYNYFDLGYNRRKVKNDNNIIRRRNYLVHDISASLRFSL